MKKIKIGFIAGVIALTATTSCKKLDLTPYDSIEVTTAFRNMQDAQLWDNGLYAILRGRVYGTYTVSQDVQADQLNATLDYGNRNGSPHRWGDSFLADDGSLTTAWQQYYYAITDINKALEGFETIAVTGADATKLNQYKGDALLARAFYYHNLIIRFAKPYEPATAATDLGVPLITKYDVSLQPSRASVKQVYDQIIADITQAKTYLTSVAGVPGAKTFTIDAALALEARVRLHMQDWTGAYTAANTVIGRSTYPLISSIDSYKAYWATDGTQESILQMNVNTTNEFPNVNNIYLGYLAGNKRFDPDFVPAQWVINSYADADIRKTAYFESKPIAISTTNNINLILVNKYPGNPSLFTTATTNYAHAPKVFRVAELYVIAAEAAYKAGNEGNALTVLNALRTARGIGSVNVSGTALYQAIKDERFRELAFEGFRLFDLKRWHEGFTRHDAQNTSVINRGATFDALSVPANADKFTWGIPTNDIIINSNLVQNPGW
ncbi:RagB/SusD family nutrient uptake outer membrane protein [Mucilaginibacter lacusdianchii]|uniref:RagB/SusD family nutrient uptake outer membrane protein n=1 Tax=Mucilaginibacter lacusdianchii TaxID=2684211 RepID=UPI00131A6E38|nr:RagB/SusD family nutrient uptake outer membrane protein [Mucilaginibacter sp. JXJ CY 39]